MFKYLLYGIVLCMWSMTIFAQTGSIDGNVWNDLNGNSSMDGGEAGLTNWNVLLSGPRTDSMFSDAGGYYNFNNLPNGLYSVRITVKNGWSQTYPSGGVHQVSINNTQVHNVNLGVKEEPINNASISGVLFNDLNGNGTKEGDESIITGWNVRLNGTKTDSMLSGVTGMYSFGGLAAGNYSVQVDVPSGYTVTVPPTGSYTLTLTSGQNAIDQNFGYSSMGGVNPGSISGLKYHDLDSNGVQDSGEPGIAGWNIRLGGAKIDSMLTDALGQYSFGGLLPGTYTVSEELKAGWVQHEPASVFYTVALAEGEALTGYDFGNTELVVPSISINDTMVVEGDVATRPIVFTVSLSSPSPSTVTVNYTTVAGTATDGSDYIGESGTVTFAPYVTSETISVDVYGDTVAERNEKLTISLSVPVNATIADATGDGIIINDDAPPGGGNVPHPGDDDYCVCTPLVGNYPSTEEQYWFVTSSGGPMNIRVIARAVNPTDPESVYVRVYDARDTLLVDGGLSYTALEAASGGPGFEKYTDITVGGRTAGDVLTVVVTTPSPTPPTQTHYRLQICGAVSAGVSSLTFAGFEDEPAVWYFNIVDIAELTIIDVNTDGVPEPATSMTFSVFDQYNVYKGTETVTIGSSEEIHIPITKFQPGMWSIRIDSINGHYRLEKMMGTDKAFYAGWNSGAHSTKHVVIKHEDSLAIGKEYQLKAYQSWKVAAGTYDYHEIGSATTTAGGYDFKHLLPGYYKFTVTPVDSTHITTPEAQYDTLLCGQEKANLFATNDTTMNVTLTLIRDQKFYGMGWVRSTPAGISVPSLDSIKDNINDTVTAVFEKNTYVGLKALTAVPYQFFNWERDTDEALDDFESDMDTTSIYMDSNRTVTVTFVGTAEVLNVSVNDTSMGSVVGVGDSFFSTTLDCGGDCSKEYPYGYEAVLSAVAKPGYRFVGWSGDASGTDTVATVLMDTTRNVTATFESTDTTTYYKLSVYQYNPGCVVSSPAGISCEPGSDTVTGMFAKGTALTLYATASEHYHFAAWYRGDDIPIEDHFADTLDVVIESDTVFAAIFLPNHYSITVAVNDTSRGSVVNQSSTGDIDCGDDCYNVYDYGDTVPLAARPNRFYKFAGWGGDASGSDTTYSIVIDTNKSVTAKFDKRTYSVFGSVDFGSFTPLSANAVKIKALSTTSGGVLAIGSLGDSLLTDWDSGQRFSLELWTGEDYTLYIIPPDGYGIRSAQGGAYQLSYSGQDTVELAPCSLYLDTLLYRTASYHEWATATNSKGKMEPEKRSAISAEFRFTVPIDTGCVNGLHLEFSSALDTLFGLTTDTLGIAEPVDSKRKKWNISFDHQLCTTPATIAITGKSTEGKYQKISMYWWTKDGVLKGKKKKTVTFTKNTLVYPMPNLHNVGSELFPRGFGQTGSLFDNGLLVGIPQGSKKANSVTHKTYADVLKSFSKKGKNGLLLHDTQVRCLDTLDNGRPISTQLKTLAPDKQNNKLFAEALTLKLNIAASIGNKFPNGFGELTFSDPSDMSNPFNGMMVERISAISDSVLSCMGIPYTEDELYAVMALVNESFSDSTVDTLSFISKTMLKGVRHLTDVPYLHLTPGVTPKSIDLRYDVSDAEPQRFMLNQNYPNPFNPTTSLSFALHEFGFVSLKVYDVLGREVAVLLDKEGFDAGDYEVPFEAGMASHPLASGIYYYRIHIQSPDQIGGDQGFTDVKRMVFIK